MQVTYYETSTGKVVGAFSGLDQDALLNLPNNCSIYYGFVDEQNCYIKNGLVVQLPEQPNSYSYFDYQTEQWVNQKTSEVNKLLIADQRQKLLTNSDWTQLSDVYIANKSQWLTYRQALRDIPSQANYPDTVVWPTLPS